MRAKTNADIAPPNHRTAAIAAYTDSDVADDNPPPAENPAHNAGDIYPDGFSPATRHSVREAYSPASSELLSR